MNKTKILILALILALLLATGLALAQGITEIDWWIFSSGGGLVNDGDGIALNTSLGQPVIGASSNGSISLSAGYWAVGDCTAAVTPGNMSISLTGADVQLSWDDDPANASGYEVHRSTSPYFTPDAGSLHQTLPAGSTFYTDAGATGSTSENYFYIVRGLSNCDAPSSYEKRLGEFDFELVAGSG